MDAVTQAAEEDGDTQPIGEDDGDSSSSLISHSFSKPDISGNKESLKMTAMGLLSVLPYETPTTPTPRRVLDASAGTGETFGYSCNNAGMDILLDMFK